MKFLAVPLRWPRPPRGFTLIELLVAMGMLGIVVALALPAYREQVARARRSDAQTVLLEDAHYMQRYYAAHDAFDGTPPPALTFANSPRSGAANYHVTVSIPADAPNGFLLTATRIGAMAGDRCGDLTYDDVGRRGLAAGTADAQLSVEACWR